jgi:ribosome biogenesis GTPase
MSLQAYGWNDAWAARLAGAGHDGGEVARVVAEHRGAYRVHDGNDELPARISGRLRHDAEGGPGFPAVGDWVVIESSEQGGEALIQAVLPRVSKFSRKAAGKRTDEQVVGANIDTVWIVTALDADFSPNRIERYLTLVWESGATPVVILTKADLCEDPEPILAELSSRLLGLPVHAVCALDGAGTDVLHEYLAPGHTIALLGSSGVGKSTLINRLAGREVMRTAPVREHDGKGRHTTSHRQLVKLPSGGLLLDTPGMREIQLWSGAAGLEKGFSDIEDLATGCRYADCSHDSEPGCAVRAAVDGGDLPHERLESYRKLQKELAYIKRKQNIRAEQAERQRWKEIIKSYRKHFKQGGRS